MFFPKKYYMKTALIKTILYILAAMMVTGWIVSMLFFVTGMLVHILLIAAVLFVMQATIICPKPQRNVVK